MEDAKYSRADREDIETTAVQLAGSYHLEWEDLPDDAGMFWWKHSKNKFRRRAVEAKEYLAELSRHSEHVRKMAAKAAASLKPL